MRHPFPVALALILLGCDGRPPLAFVPWPVPIGHDAFEVHDVALVDIDQDGDADILAATADGIRYLRREANGWVDATPGTALDRLDPVQRLHPQGEGCLMERDGQPSRLVYTGIGSWNEEPAHPPIALPLIALELSVDLDGDGQLDRVSVLNGRARIELGGEGGVLLDVTAQVGADGAALRGRCRRVLARDLDGDGDLDVMLVGGRILVLLNNGGQLLREKQAGLWPLSWLPSPPTQEQRPAAAPARAPWFADATQRAGLAFVHVEGEEQWDIRPTMGPGAAWADVDGDGDADLFAVGGSGQAGALFLNDGQAVFEDVTEAWGLAERGAGMGASFADYDEDGDPDLYVTQDGPNVLWRNDGGSFTDVTRASGTGDPGWGASAAWADVDNDGDLDLFVTNYLLFDTDLIPPESERPAFRREDPIAMLPYVFPGQANVLYRNEGNGTFTDVTRSAGLEHPDGKSLGAAFFDHDADGWLDLLVANDTTPNTFWHNQGDGSFVEQALFVGLDDPRGGMGVALDDVDDDGDEDAFVTYWQLEPNALYRNNAVHPPTTRRFVPRFEDISVLAGLAQPSVGLVGWGCALADLDNDGDSDLMVANGYTSPDYETTMQCVGQPDQLFENVTEPGSLSGFRDVPRFRLLAAAEAGAAFVPARASRGVAAADADGDGDLDLVVTSNNGPLVYLENLRGGRSLRVVPEGTTCNRDAVGARVTLLLEDGGQRVAFVRNGASYLSGHERGVRFGLGSRRPRELHVAWPDGSSSTHPARGPGLLRLRQPAARPGSAAARTEETAMNPLRVTSPAFAPGQALPPKYTCDGDDISPPLSWEAGPAGTASYALIMDDPDATAGTWVHWLAWNLRGTELAGERPAGPGLPDGARQGRNSWGRFGYGGPCPPAGTHRYFLRVFALDAELSLPHGADRAALERALEGHVLARGELMGVYARRR